jgi:signal transduction histidine kinase
VSTATATYSANPTQRLEELSRIIMAYSEITERLQASHDRLEATVRSLRQELVEKDRLLERKNRLAALGEMAAGMAHEIRNPLGAIQLCASLLARDVADRPQAAQHVSRITAAVRRLESLVSQVLQFTREMKANLCDADLALVIDEAMALAEAAIRGRPVDVYISGPRPMPVHIDPLLMGQALMNLLVNAAQAAPPGGHVWLRYATPRHSAEGRQFHLTVEDDGPGIAPAFLDRIFDPFFTTRDGGTGLGLAIVHRIVEAHEGCIRASNRTDGGACFDIRI